ncbi:hypothetical protein HF086_011104 [Spodoptera exigua]|uniref:Uncharacterized protein n=1 Tax=Spodoptera exigua TaxID=7107 RepID=A0A922MFH9_SPOEX|nr:hypothetical protein HF086_011104 [Spodoptera exigua]
MVIFLVKRNDENQFLYETDVDKEVDDVVKDITAIFNGRLKIKELKLEDPWAKRCAPPGHVFVKDEMGRRCGLAPPPNMQEVIKKAAEDAKEFISKKHVVTVKLCSNSEGAPGREPIMSEEERKQLTLHAYRKQEEWKKLEADEDDSYMDSKWADGQNMKRYFHGLENISWKPTFKK